MSLSPYSAFSEDTRVIRHQHGFRLATPADVSGCLTVKNIFDLPMPAYFLDTRSHMVAVNEETAELVGRQTISDTLGKTAIDFCSSEFGSLCLYNDSSVIASGKSKVIEETGHRNDDALLQVISFKLPWYLDDKIIGLLGFSIYTDADSFNDFAPSLSQLLSTGLLDSNASGLIPKFRYNNFDIHLSQRENEIMMHLSRGRTAKNIAIILGISYRTVENHIARIKNKFDCTTKSELIDLYQSLDCA
jgi:DNA-binding CsgD family transcriptional regulator